MPGEYSSLDFPRVRDRTFIPLILLVWHWLAANMKTITTLLLLITVSAQVAADEWPTTEFIVRQGSPDMDYSVSEKTQQLLNKLHAAIPDSEAVADKAHAVISDPKAGFKEAMEDANKAMEGIPEATPLTETQLADMQDYLKSVAEYLQEEGFPAPTLARTDQMEDPPGTQLAYAVYYYPQPDSWGYAKYIYSCDAGGDYFVHVNAAKFLNGNKISAKGYSVLAHELFHSIQRSTEVGRRNCVGYGDWINEGQAEAFGHDMARRFRNSVCCSTLVRWGGRASYADSLYVKSAGSSKIAHDRAYQTSSFWRYITEAWHRETNLQVSGGPGPNLDAEYGTDYGAIAILMMRAIGSNSESAELRWLDTWLKANLGGGLDKVYTEFVSVLAEYGLYRIKGTKSAEEQARRWRNTVFGGEVSGDNVGSACQSIDLQPDATAMAISLTLNKVASRCVELDVGAFNGTNTFEIAVLSREKGERPTVHLTLAGGQQTMLSAEFVKTPEGEFLSKWPFELKSDTKQYLIITNVAQNAGATEAQTIDLHVGLSMGKSNMTPHPFQSRKKKKKARKKPEPGPAGAKQAHENRHADMHNHTTGPHSAQWTYRNKRDRCKQTSAWRGKCESLVTINLGMSMPLPEASLTGASEWSGAGIASGFTGMPNLDVAEMVRREDWEENTAGTKVEIEIPEIDYGFTGTISDARIWVSGGADAQGGLISYTGNPNSPRPPCGYGGPPIGSVTIDEFSRFVLRGSYTAPLIVVGGIRNVSHCPIKPVVQTISGTFVVTLPYMKDPRVETDTSWLLADGVNSLQSLMPGGFNLDQLEEMSKHVPKPPVNGGSPDFTPEQAEDQWETGAGECKCDCDEFSRAIKASKSIIGQPDKEEMRLLMCLGLCAGKNSDCPL